MKDRIGTLSYDTETAKKIAGCKSSLPKNDFGYYEEALYKKRTGEYFLAGWGGPDSKYKEIAPGENAFEEGSKIIPFTFKQAKNWFKAFILDSDDYGLGDEESKKETEHIYEQEFDPTNDKQIIQTHLNISIRAKRKLERIAQKAGKTQSEVIENMIMADK